MTSPFQVFDKVRLIKTGSPALDNTEALVIGFYGHNDVIIMFGKMDCAGPGMIITQHCLEKIN